MWLRDGEMVRWRSKFYSGTEANAHNRTSANEWKKRNKSWEKMITNVHQFHQIEIEKQHENETNGAKTPRVTL